MFDVFISYSTKNQFDADLVKRVLENNGISCWMAPDNIPSGSNYAREIPTAIQNSRVFVLLLSRVAQLSQWVTKELDLAVNKRKVIIPFVLEECELLDEFNFYLVGAQRLNAYHRKADALKLLVQRLQVLLEAEVHDDPERVTADVRSAENHLAPAYSAEEIVACVREYVDMDFIRKRRMFRIKNTERLRRNLQIPKEDDIILAFDDTLLRTGKYGFALCSSGIYARSYIDRYSTYMSWKSFVHAEGFRYRDVFHYEVLASIADGEIRIASVRRLIFPDKQMILRFFQRLQHALRQEVG